MSTIKDYQRIAELTAERDALAAENDRLRKKVLELEHHLSPLPLTYALKEYAEDGQ